MAEGLNYDKCSFFAYEKTGGSNLDPQDQLIACDGEVISFENDLCPHYDLIFAISDYSPQHPPPWLKGMVFKNTTLHGVNDIILNSGLSVDYKN